MDISKQNKETWRKQKQYRGQKEKKNKNKNKNKKPDHNVPHTCQKIYHQKDNK